MNDKSKYCWSTRSASPDCLWAMAEEYYSKLMGAATASQQGNFEIVARERDIDVHPDIVNGVAVIDIVGPMMKHLTLFDAFFGGATSMGEIEAKVRTATNDDAVNAIMLRIDSPGGTVAGVSDLADAVFDARKQKPVVSYISDLGASAAYYVASQADQVFADRDALVGSIGTFLVVPDFSGMAEEQGVKVHVIKSGQFKGSGTPGTKVTDSQLAEFQRLVDDLGRTFVQDVSRGRGMTPDAISKLADGRVHIGPEAESLGLIDGVQSMNQTFSNLQQQSLAGSDSFATWRKPVDGGVTNEPTTASIS